MDPFLPMEIEGAKGNQFSWCGSEEKLLFTDGDSIRVWSPKVGGLEAQVLPDTEGAWSPVGVRDGSEVIFLRDDGKELWRHNVAAGISEKLWEMQASMP